MTAEMEELRQQQRGSMIEYLFWVKKIVVKSVAVLYPTNDVTYSATGI